MSNLIISNRIKTALELIKNKIESKENTSINILNNIDIFYSNKEEENLSTEGIRNINKFLNEKSLILKNKYVILTNFNRASTEAQNAFLKTLEENKNDIYLIAKNTNGILQTIISRVFIININSKTTFNIKIQNMLHRIITKKNLEEIKDLTKKYKYEKLLDNLEYYLNKNKTNYSKGPLSECLQKIYSSKKRSTNIKLNSEIQFTNIIVSLLE